MNTLELMSETAKHLSGYDVAVTIQEPQTRGAGECWFEVTEAAIKGNEPCIKIAISPRVVDYGDEYLRIFLHEVAHAKLHVTEDNFDKSLKAYQDCDPETAYKMETEANRLAARWQHYAKTHSESFRYMPDVGGVNAAANYFRLQLLTLLKSQEVTEF